jgi:acyl-CoA dehydrogenase
MNADEAETLAKGIIDGLFGFIEAEVLPLERQYRELLADERKLFKDDGRLVDEIAAARLTVRRKSAESGFYTLLAPTEVGGSGAAFAGAVLVLEAVPPLWPRLLLIGWSNGFPDHAHPCQLRRRAVACSQRRRGCRRDVSKLLAGEKTVCFGLTEPDAGSTSGAQVQGEARRTSG